MAAPALLRQVLRTADPDAELLGRFAARRDPEAFAELVRRHGPVVYRVCRRLLGEFAADDAFQATFLVLATKPNSVRKAASVGSWLVGVAGRVARQTRKARLRRTFHEQASVQHREPPQSPEFAEQFRILDEELTRLPDRLRDPIVLCLLQGRTQEQAAEHLGGSVRTVRRRLDEAKHLLRTRLERRGIVPAVAAGLVAGAGSVTAAVPMNLPDRTASIVFDFLAGGAARSAPAALLAQGVATTMLARNVKLLMLTAALGLTALGVGLADDGSKPKPEAAKPEKPASVAVDQPKAEPSDKLPPQNVPIPAPAAPAAVANAPADADYYPALNFVVYAPNSMLSKEIAYLAEAARSELALAWLGRDLPRWEKPCRIDVESQMTATGGATTFTFSDDPAKPAVKTMQMKITGDLNGNLRGTLRHEVMHCILATHFGKPLHRWADEGIAVLAEGPKGRYEHDIRCRELLNAGRGIPLKVLFELKEYPKDMIVLFAQGSSVCEFLLSRETAAIDAYLKEMKPGLVVDRDLLRRQLLIQFVAAGQAEGWEAAAKLLYGFDSLDAMQEAWFAWLRQAPKAANTTPPPPVAHAKTAPEAPEFPKVGGFVLSPRSFTVKAPSSAIARSLANELAYQRRQQSGAWVGWRIPQVVSTPVRVEYEPDATEAYLNVAVADDQTRPDFIRLAGPLHGVLDQSIPQFMVRMVFIEHVGRDLPAWCVSGLPAIEATPGVQRLLDAQARTLMSEGKAVKLTAFFTADPSRSAETMAQAHSVVRFLLTRPVQGSDIAFPIIDANGKSGGIMLMGTVYPKYAVTEFIRRGLKSGWDAAAKEVYGFAGVDDLEAKWIAWLKTPESKLADPTSPPTPVVPRIPPVKLTAEVPDEPGVETLHTRTLKLDIQYLPNRRNTVRTVQLQSSRDQGKTWKVEDAVTPDKDHLLFKAPEDGLYWLRTVIEYKDGSPAETPSNTGYTKIRIDTTTPKQPDRVGRISIEGNTITDNQVILDQLGFGPGQRLDPAQLKTAEKKLAGLGVFDPATPPTVEVIANEQSEYKDIRIRVKEKAR